MKQKFRFSRAIRNPSHAMTPFSFPVRITLSLLTAGLLTAVPLAANEPPPRIEHEGRILLQQPRIFFGNPESMIGTELLDDPYWEETVNRALEELESEEAEIRRSAVMLLGKYPVPSAQEAVVRSLGDGAAPVRQAALVSLFETPRPTSTQVAVKVVALVGDEDTGIRRIASNMIPHILQSFPFTMRPGDRQPRRNMPDEAAAVLVNAFLDEDVSVRRNMVSHYPMLRIELPESTIARLLMDEDREVAVQTLGWGLREIGPDRLDTVLSALAKREESVIRMELARNLQGRHERAAEEALRVLRDDEDPGVSLEARLGLFQKRPNESDYREIVELVRSSRPRGETVNRVIMATQFLGADGRPFLLEWLEDSNSAHRFQAAALLLSRMQSLTENRDLVARLLRDSSSQVREQAMQAVIRRAAEIDDDLLRDITENPHRDVRRVAIHLANNLDPRRAKDLLMDLLLDEAVEVRLHALQAIGNRNMEGWSEIMGFSLRDGDPAIRQTAAQWLLRSTEEPALTVLRDYLVENPRSPLRSRIETHLRRHDPTLL